MDLTNLCIRNFTLENGISFKYRCFSMSDMTKFRDLMKNPPETVEELFKQYSSIVIQQEDNSKKIKKILNSFSEIDKEKFLKEGIIVNFPELEEKIETESNILNLYKMAKEEDDKFTKNMFASIKKSNKLLGTQLDGILRPYNEVMKTAKLTSDFMNTYNKMIPPTYVADSNPRPYELASVQLPTREENAIQNLEDMLSEKFIDFTKLLIEGQKVQNRSIQQQIDLMEKADKNNEKSTKRSTMLSIFAILIACVMPIIIQCKVENNDKKLEIERQKQYQEEIQFRAKLIELLEKNDSQINEDIFLELRNLNNNLNNTLKTKE